MGWRELKGVKGCANKTPFIVRFQSDRGGVGGGGQERVSLIEVRGAPRGPTQSKPETWEPETWEGIHSAVGEVITICCPGYLLSSFLG